MAELRFAFGGQRSAELMFRIAQDSEGVKEYDDRHLVADKIIISRLSLPTWVDQKLWESIALNYTGVLKQTDYETIEIT